MTERVVVFLDWQNVYRRGREAFCTENAPHVDGQVDPLLLAERLATREPDRRLQQVRIYRGIPTNEKDPKGYAANRRHTAAWMRTDPKRIHVYLRPLQYLPGMDPREKGIDVQLAIDFVVMAVRREYDVGILFSTDTDLKPALDAVCDLRPNGGPIAEVAAWSGPNAQPRRITATRPRQVACHWLGPADFAAVADTRNYAQP
jgi:uncharacterized LabA/DUF88 family protein